jgi:hypothetical protein
LIGNKTDANKNVGMQPHRKISAEPLKEKVINVSGLVVAGY